MSTQSLSEVDRKVLAAFRARSEGDRADVLSHDIEIRGETRRTIDESLARLVHLKYLNKLSVFGRGPALRALIEADATGEDDTTGEDDHATPAEGQEDGPA